MKRDMLRAVGICLLGAGLFLVTPAHVIAANTNAATQTQDRAGHRHEVLERLKAALEKLDLTADQKAKIKAIVADTRTKLQALRAEAKSGGTDQIREKAKAIIKDAREQIAAVLTPEQKAQLKSMKEKFQEGHDAKGGASKGNA